MKRGRFDDEECEEAFSLKSHKSKLLAFQKIRGRLLDALKHNETLEEQNKKLEGQIKLSGEEWEKRNEELAQRNKILTEQIKLSGEAWEKRNEELLERNKTLEEQATRLQEQTKLSGEAWEKRNEELLERNKTLEEQAKRLQEQTKLSGEEWEKRNESLKNKLMLLKTVLEKVEEKQKPLEMKIVELENKLTLTMQKLFSKTQHCKDLVDEKEDWIKKHTLLELELKKMEERKKTLDSNMLEMNKENIVLTEKLLLMTKQMQKHEKERNTSHQLVLPTTITKQSSSSDDIEKPSFPIKRVRKSDLSTVEKCKASILESEGLLKKMAENGITNGKNRIRTLNRLSFQRSKLAKLEKEEAANKTTD